MCAHKKCQGIIPHTCGMQIQEKHGRINLSYYTERLKEDEWKINIEGTCMYMYMYSVGIYACVHVHVCL